MNLLSKSITESDLELDLMFLNVMMQCLINQTQQMYSKSNDMKQTNSEEKENKPNMQLKPTEQFWIIWICC